MKRILIVEDDLAYSYELEELLKNDYEVEKVVDGVSALGKIRANPFELVILDLTILGQVDGNQLLTSIKNDRATEKAYVLVLTNAGVEKKDEILSLGADEYIIKEEVDFNSLKSKIDQILASR